VRFLVDAQLPPALARQIQDLGHTAEHVADCGLGSAPDDAIRDHAVRTGAVIVTKDEDFAVRRVLGSGPTVVWLRMGNTRSATLLQRMEADLPAIVLAIEQGETLVEIA
jgi:predicted nuclease of predicted toxin-antitoxin system